MLPVILLLFYLRIQRIEFIMPFIMLDLLHQVSYSIFNIKVLVPCWFMLNSIASINIVRHVHDYVKWVIFAILLTITSRVVITC